MSALCSLGKPVRVTPSVASVPKPCGALISGQNLIVDGGTTIGDGN